MFGLNKPSLSHEPDKGLYKVAPFSFISAQTAMDWAMAMPDTVQKHLYKSPQKQQRSLRRPLASHPSP
jgi:hypothetical protein